MKRIKLIFALSSIILLALSISGVAQVTKGSLSGTVVDQTGAVVPAAQVTATQTETGSVLKMMTDKAGNFRFNLIPPGVYNVEVSKEGFSTFSQTGIRVSTGQDSSLGSVKMSVGVASQTVEVSATSGLVETTQTQVTNTFTNQTFQSVPGVADNQGLDNLALFVPGVASTRDNSFSNSNGASFSVNGLRGRNNDQQIDGQNNNDNSVGGPALFLSNQEFVGEYQIVTDNFGPEYGRNAGSVVNIITKSGTNNLHGSIYGSENNSVLNAMNNIQKRFLGMKKLPRSNNEFTGFSIGGPMIKDKLFFFGGFDNQIVTSQTVYSTGSLTPTPTGIGQLSGCYPGSTSLQALAKYGPYGIGAGNPTPTNITVVPMVGTCPNVQFGGVQRTLSTPFHGFDWIFKVDFQGNRDVISARYMFNRNNNFNIDEGNAVAGYPANVPGLNQQTRLSWTRNFTSRMVNEFAVTFGRLNAEFGGNAYGNTIPTTGGIFNAVTNVTTGSGNLGFGPPTNMPQGRIVNTWQLQDNWNFMLGNHSLKAGVNWTYQRSPNVFMPNLNGAFSFTSWANFAANKPSTVSISLGNPSLDFREYDTFLYFGDEWKVKSNLTLNYGVTWTYYGQPANLFNQLDTKQQTGSTPFWKTSLPLSVTTSPKLAAPKDSFGPSVGFAWTPKGFGWLTGNGKTVLRGGYRLSYDPPFYNIYLNMASSAPQVLSQSLSSPPFGLPADPTGPNVRALLAPYLTLGVSDPRNVVQTQISPNFGPDHVHSWSFGIQREIGKDVVFEARYVGNSARDLFQSIDGNPYVNYLAAAFPSLVPSGVTGCTSANAIVPAAVGRANCSTGRLRIRQNSGYSDYNGLQTELRANNLFNQLLIRASYTYSKTTDNASEIFGTGGAGNTTAFSQNPFNYTTGEHGISGLDIPQNFTVSFVEQFPFMKSQKGLLGHLVGGWAIAGSYILASGQPYTPLQYCIAYSGCGGGTVVDPSFYSAYAGTYDGLRPFWGNPSAPATSVGAYAGDVCNYWGTGCGLPANTLLDWGAAVASNGANVKTVTKSQVRYIVNAATSQGIFGTPFGNVPRNAARDFWTNVGNASIYKTTRLSEHVRAEWHVTMNNVFNHRSFGSVDPYIDDAGLQQEYTGFGDPSLTNGGARTITFGAAIRW